MNEYFVAWWNLENLFDVENSTNRPDWLQKSLEKELKGWSQNILNTKLNQLAKIIPKLNNNKGPDILGVCEIENKPVLEKLNNCLNIPNRKYEIIHEDTKDKRGIDVAFIVDENKFCFNEKFSHFILKRTATRDLFQINLKSKYSQKELILIGNHWPSRRGGDFETEPYRILAAETLSYWLKRIQEIKGKDIAIVIMGDFNDEPFNRSMTQYALSTRNRTKVKNSKTPRMYNLMWPVLGQSLGTYYYNNFPCLFDQFLLSKGFTIENAGFKAKVDSIRIEKFTGMYKGSYEVPRAFGRPSSSLDTQGFSDHFPISMVLQET